MKEYKEGDIIICTVKDIVKTTVFVETEEGLNGSINFSEVAPGRIRNIRDYVVPHKVIVCKVLDVKPDHLFLSIRRVKEKDRKEILENFKKGKTTESILKKIIGEKADEIIKKIKLNEDFIELFEKAKQNVTILDKYFTKQEIEKISPILKEKKEKEVELKKEFSLSSKEHDGIIRIKKLLSQYNNISYLGSSKFMIKTKSTNPKQANTQLNQIIETIEKEAKKNKCEFAFKK